MAQPGFFDLSHDFQGGGRHEGVPDPVFCDEVKGLFGIELFGPVSHHRNPMMPARK